MASNIGSYDHVILGLALVLSVESGAVKNVKSGRDRFTYAVGISAKQLDAITKSVNPKISRSVEKLALHIKEGSQKQYNDPNPIANIKALLSDDKYISDLEELKKDQSWIASYPKTVLGLNQSPVFKAYAEQLTTGLTDAVFNQKPIDDLKKQIDKDMPYLNVDTGMPYNKVKIAPATSLAIDELTEQFNKLKEFEVYINQLKNKASSARRKSKEDNLVDRIPVMGQNKPMTQQDKHSQAKDNSASITEVEKPITEYSEEMTFDEFSQLLDYQLKQTKAKKHIREDLTEREVNDQFHLFSMFLEPTFLEVEPSAFDQVVLDQLKELAKTEQKTYVDNVKKKYLALRIK